ncbi:hypothetical protein HY214_05355 [Candidatus Roizmanbacteria bacterium]|nr:hypothetical protein [Candidatus Roizmanbacteria bacterium]
MEPHVLMHSLFGLGLGVIAANLFPTLVGQNGMLIGIGALVVGVAGDWMVNK